MPRNVAICSQSAATSQTMNLLMCSSVGHESMPVEGYISYHIISLLFKCAMCQGTLGPHCPMQHCDKNVYIKQGKDGILF